MKSSIKYAFYILIFSHHLIFHAAAQTYVNQTASQGISTMAIGNGYDHRKLDEKPREPVIALGTGVAQDSNSANGLEFTAYYLEHQYDLARIFKLNGSMTAKYAKAGGGISWNYMNSFNFSENTINFVMVCSRDFGTTYYTNYTLHPSFDSFVTTYRSQGLSRKALHDRVVEQYGTHFVSGYRSAARAYLVYSFHFDSTTTAESFSSSLNASYKAGISRVDFQTTVSSLLETKSQNTSISIKFFNSNSRAPIFVPPSTINTAAEFNSLQQSFADYCNGNMEAATATEIGYYIAPLANLGTQYLNFLDGYVPGAQRNTDYDQFLEVFGQLQQWYDTYTTWMLNPRRMNWMNAAGTNLVGMLRQDALRYLRTLEAAAKDHFDNGTDLEVGTEILSFVANAGRVPMPKLSVVRPFSARNQGEAGNSWLFGIIDSGPIEYTIDNPFQGGRVILTSGGVNQTPESTDGQIYYNFSDFKQAGLGVDNRISPNEFDSPIWLAIQDLATRNRIGFWIWHDKPINAYIGKELAIKDGDGNVVDRVPASKTNLRFASSSTLASVTNEVAVGIVSRPTAGIHDSVLTQVYSVTNSGPGAAYNIAVTLPIPTNMVFIRAIGTQGGGAFTNNSVVYDVGPLGSGDVATIRLLLAPATTGRLTTGGTGNLRVGDGLTNIGTNTTVGPHGIDVAAPGLTHSKNTNYVELKWVSATGRLGVESSTNLRLSTWATNGTANVESEGVSKTLRLPLTNTSGFFRLRSQ